MGLFDSLLGNTSTPGQENTATPAAPTANMITPVEANTEHSVGESSPISPDNAMNSLVITPTPITNATLSLMGEGDTSTDDMSSVLISETPAPSNEVDTATPVITETPVQNGAFGTSTLPESADNIPLLTEMPHMMPLTAEAPVEAPVQEVSPTNTEDATPLVSATEDTEALSHTEAFASTTSDATNDSLFENIATSEEASNETTPVMETTETLSAVASETPASHTAVSADDFISASLKELDRMLENIQSQKTAHLDRAEEYRKQKEALAQQEIDAKKQAHGLDDEMAHIEEMRTYLEKQKAGKGSATKNSVKTTLTGISVQQNVEDTITKKSARRTPKKAVSA